MRKFSKVVLILAGIFAAVGIGFAIAGAAMGATMESVDLVKKVVMDFQEKEEEDSCDGGKSVPGKVNGNVRTYEVAMASDLKIDLKYDELLMKSHTGSNIRVEVENDSGESVNVKADSDKVKITSKKKNNKRKITVYYPADERFENVGISIGAGEATVESSLVARELDISVGAGSFDGSGALTVKECDVEVGVGEVSLKGLTAEKIEGQCGIGEINLTLAGTEKDYNYKLECGVGNIGIGEEDYSGIASARNINNDNAGKTLELECGMGSIHVEFEQ